MADHIVARLDLTLLRRFGLAALRGIGAAGVELAAGRRVGRGRNGTLQHDALPLDRLTGYAPGTGAAYKYYYTQPTPAGWLTGIYTASGHSFTLDYRADSASAAVPYVGIWINNGAFRDYYNIALECCTAPYDAPDKAEAHGYPASLPPHASRRFTLRVRVE